MCLLSACSGFQLLMRHRFGVTLDKMPAKVVEQRDVSSIFEQCGAEDWSACCREAVFSHAYMVPPLQNLDGKQIQVVHDGRLTLGCRLPDGSCGVQFHPECCDGSWELVLRFLSTPSRGP